MTSNTIRYKEAESAVKRQKEDQRRGRSLERSEKFKNIGQGIGGIGKAAADVGKTIMSAIGMVNDPSWYFADPETARTVGNLSFANPLGTSLTAPSSGTTLVKEILPGIAVHKFVPTIGGNPGGSNSQSIIDVAARNVYAFVRYKNSGHANYDSPDYMMYLLAMDSMFMQYAELVRLYGALNYVNPLNRYSQQRLVEALGFSFDDCISQMNDIRAYILLLRQRLSAFYLPKMLSYYIRHIWLCSNLFLDDPLAKGQLHLFRPSYVFYYDEANSQLLSLIHDSGTLKSFDAFRTQVELCFKYLLESESIGIMSGDTLKAYGDTGVMTIPPLSEDFTATPVFSQEILEQIQNATVFLPPNAFSGWSVFAAIRQDPDTGALYQGRKAADGAWGVEIYTEAGVTSATRMLNVRYDTRYLIAEEDAPTAERVMTMSRLTCTATRYNNDGDEMGWRITNCGSEIILGSYIHSNLLPNPVITVYWDGKVILNISDLDDVVRPTRFEYFPFIRWTEYESFDPQQPKTIEYCHTYNCSNVTSVDGDTLRKFHTVALTSMFGVPYHGETGSLTR